MPAFGFSPTDPAAVSVQPNALVLIKLYNPYSLNPVIAGVADVDGAILVADGLVANADQVPEPIPDIETLLN